jgi:hypothetical protein
MAKTVALKGLQDTGAFSDEYAGSSRALATDQLKVSLLPYDPTMELRIRVTYLCTDTRGIP